MSVEIGKTWGETKRCLPDGMCWQLFEVNSACALWTRKELNEDEAVQHVVCCWTNRCTFIKFKGGSESMEVIKVESTWTRKQKIRYFTRDITSHFVRRDLTWIETTISIWSARLHEAIKIKFPAVISFKGKYVCRTKSNVGKLWRQGLEHHVANWCPGGTANYRKPGKFTELLSNCSKAYQFCFSICRLRYGLRWNQ